MSGKFNICSAVVTIAFSLCMDAHSQNRQSGDDYIVVLKKAPVISSRHVVTNMMHSLADKHRLQVRRIFSVAVKGGVYQMTEAQARLIRRDPTVAYVEKDQRISINSTQNGVTWGLDRLDQASLPLNQSYTSPDGGAVVHAYIIDTGILSLHSDFQGRAASGRDLVDDDDDATDCNGHGTHVAGTVGAKTYGVAKAVKLHGVRVLDCAGSGTYAGVIAGIEWVTANHIKPAVANMSLGGPPSQAVNDAVNASIAAGVTYVVAAGNENADACGSTPASVLSAITVGSTTNSDARSSFSNFGTCVDIFAPGSDIKSLWYTSISSTNTISGTSMAAPHVAGVAALYLAKNPTASPAQVGTALAANSLSGKVSNPGAGSPNKLANIAFLNGGGAGPPPDEDDDSVLQNGEMLRNLSGPLRSEVRFTIQVPQGSRNLVFSLEGGSGDADMYVKSGSPPTLNSFDCRPYRVGNRETCSFPFPPAGTWHISLRGYTQYVGATLKVQYSAGLR